MSRIFVSTYLDEDVDILIAELLRSRGFESTTVRQVNRLGKTDAEQLEYAVSRGATLVTHNRSDFENLAQEYFEERKQHFGIIIAVRHPYQEVVRRLLIILDSTTADEMENQIVYI